MFIFLMMGILHEFLFPCDESMRESRERRFQSAPGRLLACGRRVGIAVRDRRGGFSFDASLWTASADLC
jgi:hypothetical protein